MSNFEIAGSTYRGRNAPILAAFPGHLGRFQFPSPTPNSVSAFPRFSTSKKQCPPRRHEGAEECAFSSWLLAKGQRLRANSGLAPRLCASVVDFVLNESLPFFSFLGELKRQNRIADRKSARGTLYASTIAAVSNCLHLREQFACTELGGY